MRSQRSSVHCHSCLQSWRPEGLHACRGRKKAALTYVITYCIGCATKHWNMFIVLLVGRLFCGVATSLLYSAFESWLVAEHFKVSPTLHTSGTAAASCCQCTEQISE